MMARGRGKKVTASRADGQAGGDGQVALVGVKGEKHPGICLARCRHMQNVE